MPNPAQSTATLMVNKSTGAITGPVTAEQFGAANDLGGGTPDAHAASHAAAGSDPVTLAQSQITNLTSDLAAKAATSDLTTHTANTSNPHSVTKTQVGLGNVDNTSDANKPVSTATQTALDLKANEADLAAHESDTSNPHSVTKTQVGLGNVDNTADSAKPISTATQTELDAKAPLASPAFTGTPTAPTAAVATDTTQIATTAFVHDAIAEIPPGATPDAEDIDIADAGSYYTGTQVEAALQEVGAALQVADTRIASLENVTPPSPTGNSLISGGGVALVSDLTISVAAATYTIGGTEYSSPLTELTADTADPTNPRIDVVAVNTSGAAVLIKGTAAATPVKPDVDPTTQLELTFFVVGAGATSLDTNVVVVYDENDDYTMTENGTSITLNSTNNPHLGTTTIEATSAAAGDYFQAEAPEPIDLGDFDNLVFFIRNKASWASAKQINITARSSGTQKGSSITFKHGLFGFDQTNTTTYQQIVIPASLFSANGQSVNQIRWAVAGGGAAIGFYVDDISLQGGLAPIVDATRMKWRGEWDSSLLYNVNDVTRRSGASYVSIQSGVNKDPNTQSGFWESMSDKAQAQYFAADAGSSDTYTATLTPTPSAYVTGAHYRFKANTANTGAATINFNGLGAKTIKKAAGGITTDLADNDIRAGQWVDLVYDGTNMQMQSLLGNAPSVGGTPGGSNRQVQFNNSSSFGGEAGFAWNASGSERTLSISGTFARYHATASDATWYASVLMSNSASRSMELGYAGASLASPPVSGGLTGEAGFIKNSGNFPIQFGTNNTFAMLLNGAGELQIGSTTDLGAYKLQVTGDSVMQGEFHVQTSGITNKFQMMVTAAGSGDIPANGAWLRSSAGHFVMFPDATGTAGSKLVMAAWNGSAFKSMLEYAHASGANTVFAVKNGGRFVIGGTDDGSTLFQVNGSAKFTSGAITTGAPSGGTAAAWKLGTKVTSGTSAINTGEYVEIDIGGTLVKLATVTNS